VAPDVRTTPSALRIPVLLGLAALAAYFLVCFGYGLDESAPRWAVPGGWQMFTVGSWSNTVVEADAYVVGPDGQKEWLPVDMAALFPSQFDSGARYRNIRTRGRAMDILADSTCDRDPRHPEQVRIVLVRWTNEIGVSPHLRRGATRTTVTDWKCSKTAKRPTGRRI
jgi:hypothetical protein